jgi:hypothetical protein
MDQSKIAHLNPQDYTHLPHAKQDFEAHEQTDVAIRPLVATLIAIAVVIIVSVIGMWGFFEMMRHFADKMPENQRMSTVETIGFRKVPEGMPDLQGVSTQGGNPNTPAEDTAKMKKHNAEVLAGQLPMRAGMPNGTKIEAAMEEALSKKIFKTASAPTTQSAAQ